MSIIRQLTSLCFVATLSSCGIGGDDENYDTGAYDTEANPYGVPAADGVESVPYQAVNPPADTNPTYGQAAYEEAAPAPTSTLNTPPTASSHTVVKGDTLWGLSRQYGVSVDAIRAVNGMAASDNTVRLGQSINIPAQ